MNKDNNTKSFNPLILIGICLILGVAITIVLLYLIFGNLLDAFGRMMELQGQPSKTAPSIASVSYLVTWVLTIYSIVVTAIFSYMVWKINNRSLIISEELKEFEVLSSNENKMLTQKSLMISEDLRLLEETREFERKRSKALVVYYDLLRGFTIIRDLFIRNSSEKESVPLEQAFFDSNWIENVASLRADLSNKDIRNLYDIYNSLYTIQKYLESNDQRIVEYVKKITQESFLEFIPINLMKEFKEHDIEELLNVEKYLLMHKLYKLTFDKSEINENVNKITILSVNYIEIISGDISNGEIIIYNANGYEKLRCYMVEGEFSTGTYKGYFGNKPQYKLTYQKTNGNRIITNGTLYNYFFEPLNEPLIDIEYLNGNPLNGKYFEVRQNGTISYWGSKVEGKKHGFGISYSNKGSLQFEGEYELGKKIKGKLYNDAKLIFEGDLHNGNPWNGFVYERDIPNSYVKKFTGKILEGKPIEGDGYVFHKSSEFSSLEDLIGNAEWAEIQQERYEEQMDAEYYEGYKEDESRYYNDDIRLSSREWTNYIKANWENGEVYKKEIKESNIIVVGYL